MKTKMILWVLRFFGKIALEKLKQAASKNTCFGKIGTALRDVCKDLEETIDDLDVLEAVEKFEKEEIKKCEQHNEENPIPVACEGKKITIYRVTRTDFYTIGNLACFEGSEDLKKAFTCKTTELPCKNNARQISCIPKGNYIVRKRWSQKFNWHLKVYHENGVECVQGRSMILIHVGNRVNWLENGKRISDTLGCILPCANTTEKNNGVFGATSRTQMDKLLEFVGNEDVALEIF